MCEDGVADDADRLAERVRHINTAELRAHDRVVEERAVAPVEAREVADSVDLKTARTWDST